MDSMHVVCLDRTHRAFRRIGLGQRTGRKDLFRQARLPRPVHRKPLKFQVAGGVQHHGFLFSIAE